MKPVFIQQPKLKGDETPEVDSLKKRSLQIKTSLSPWTWIWAEDYCNT